jgi:hypothetical protein
VAHVGQEGALGLTGGFYSILCLYQLGLDLLALGDVAVEGNEKIAARVAL